MDGKDKPEPPSEDVVEKQDPDFSEADFLKALRKVITPRPSEPDQGSPRKGARRRRGD
jgi:hypothetical protein